VAAALGADVKDTAAASINVVDGVHVAVGTFDRTDGSGGAWIAAGTLDPGRPGTTSVQQLTGQDPDPRALNGQGQVVGSIPEGRGGVEEAVEWTFSVTAPPSPGSAPTLTPERFRHLGGGLGVSSEAAAIDDAGAVAGSLGADEGDSQAYRTGPSATA